MNNNKPVTENEIQAYADNELEPVRKIFVANHLQQNAEAAQRVEAIIAQTRIVRSAAAPLLDKTVPYNLSIDRLFERERTVTRAFPLSSGKLSRRVAASLIAAFFLGAATGWGWHGEGDISTNRIRQLVNEAADAYSVYEPERLHPVEIGAGNREELMGWVSSRLQRPISAPEAVGDFQLLGGRVVATSRGPAAMFMYDNTRGKRIVMLVCPLSLHGTSPITESSPGGLSGVSWSDLGVGYSLVGPVLIEELRAMGEVVRHQMADRA